jgi:glycosyltransferase involved in cell wall biosynthesis
VNLMSAASLPDVSVVIPARNRAPLLERAIASVAAQEAVCTEVIVVDDASDPPLEALLAEKLRRRIRLLRNPSKRNAAWSRNLGAAQATAPTLAFLDADDVWRSDHLLHALAALRAQPRICLYVAPTRKRQGPARLINDPYEQRFGRGIDFRTSGFVCPRELFDALGGFDAGLEKHQDWDLALRAGRHGSLLLGAEATVEIDPNAEGRMSSTPNLPASVTFLNKHMSNMTARHLSYFFSGMIRHAALAGDRRVLDRAKVLAASHISPRELAPKALLAWHLPCLASKLALARRRLRSRMRAAK